MFKNSKNEKRISVDSNKRKNIVGEDQSSFTVELDPSFFHKPPTHIELLDAEVDYRTQLVGTNNNKFNIIKNDITYNLTVAPGDYRTTELLEIAIVDALNTLGFVGPDIITFDSTTDTHIVSNPARKESVLLGTRYTFSSFSNFAIDFNVNNSIGFLLGFGKMRGSGGLATPINSNIAPNVEDILAVHTLTSATIEANNINNSFQITNSVGTVLLFFRGTFASTISFRKYLEFVEDLINADAGIIGGGLELNFVYDDNTQQVTIFDTTNTVFGIDFVMGGINYGSPHKLLGFEKQYYQGKSSYTGKRIRVNSEFVSDDDLYITSDLVSGKDTGIIVTNEIVDSQDSSILFNIPVKNPILTRFEDPNIYIEERGRQMVDISASKLTKGFKNKTWTDTNKPTIKFTLRTSNGRHIDLRTRWSFRAIFHF